MSESNKPTNNISVKPAKLSGFFLLRDENGNPKFKDINDIPDHIFNSLQEKDKRFIVEQRALKR